MLGITGIIAEFNPFHNGHEALVAEARRRGASGVVAVMSGNFAQRGSIAVTDKRVRAKAALLCGVDLVLELPLVFAVAPAQRFARGAVETLAGTGCVDSLFFGSECGDIGALQALADAVDNPELASRIRERLAEGMTFARARELAVAEALGSEAASGLSSPNNALAVEYLRAIRAAGWDARVGTMQRLGAAHDSSRASGSFASASMLRERAADFELLRSYVPPKAAEVYGEAREAGLYPADPAKLETAVLAQLRRLGTEELATLPDLSEGIENRLYAAIRTSPTLDTLESAVKTKRYTMARVRRLVTSAFLGLTHADSCAELPYIRVLGATSGGMEILSAMKRSCSLPVSHSLARLHELGGMCTRFAELESLAVDLYSLALPKSPACGYDYTASAVFLKQKDRP